MVLTNVKGFRESPQWIRERLFSQFTEKEVSAAIDKLEAIGLVKRDSGGRLKQATRQVTTKPALRRVASKLFYESLLKRGIQALDLTDQEEREFGAYIVGLSPKQIPELKRRVRQFLSELNEWALENPSPHQVYALTFLGFPVTSIERNHCQ